MTIQQIAYAVIIVGQGVTVVILWHVIRRYKELVAAYDLLHHSFLETVIGLMRSRRPIVPHIAPDFVPPPAPFTSDETL